MSVDCILQVMVTNSVISKLQVYQVPSQYMPLIFMGIRVNF
jgi:hypothetical protein